MNTQAENFGKGSEVLQSGYALSLLDLSQTFLRDLALQFLGSY